jgi:HAD superfamily hydrolase (TIGR01509 family)
MPIATKTKPAWLFIDVGNVLVIDDYGVAHFLEELQAAVAAAGGPITHEEIMARREALVHERDDGAPYITLGIELLEESLRQPLFQRVIAEISADWARYNTPVQGVDAVLESLAREYRLALAANQPVSCRPNLAGLGWLRHFSVVGISREMGLSKPDPAFYQVLLEQAGCAPGEAVMIGDRLDNDIAPAKKLGMWTIHVRMDALTHGYQVRTPAEQRYIESLARAPVRGAGNGAGVMADATVDSIHEAPAALKRLFP